jgi:competence protein ComGC
MTSSESFLTPTSRRGGTLFDLCVVLGVIALLIAILVPMLITARGRASRFQCANNLKVIGQGMFAYASDNKGRLPATRPSSVGAVLPDVSSAGAGAMDPFAVDGPPHNNIPAALYLLIRTQGLSARDFVCPGSDAVADPMALASPKSRSNFTDVKKHLAYSMQNPYGEPAMASGFEWTRDLPADFVLVADMNPGVQGIGDNVLAVRQNCPTVQRLMSNSNNHNKQGQNVLCADGRVDFCTTALAGIRGDNIYITRSGTIHAAPESPGDNVLLPTDD